jgi:mannan endo-1,4-beta-mannosidase
MSAVLEMVFGTSPSFLVKLHRSTQEPMASNVSIMSFQAPQLTISKLVINFVNNWSDYGGMPLYNTYYGTTKATWYTTAAVQAQYKACISAVVSRYMTSTAVFAWELANEARCNGRATSVITNWATSISAYIKSLDPNHLVTLGDEGFMNGGGDGSYPYTPSEGVDFVANLKVPDLDYGIFHLYPGSCNL